MHRRTFLAASAATVIADGGGRGAVIGLLLPLSGPDAPLGRSVADSALMAADEINQDSGRRRPPIAVRTADTGSDPRRFLALLSQMVGGHRTASIFGLCPPAAAGAMRTILERGGGLFWDPAPTPGGECSDTVVHGGPTPYQSLGHLVPWLAEQVGRRFLLVGSDEDWPRALLAACRTMAEDCGAAAIGASELVPPGGADFTAILARIRRERIEVVVSALTGASATAFLRRYREAGHDPREVPIASPTLSELVAAAAGPQVAAGAVAAAPYFASWPSSANSLFTQRLRRHAGAAAIAGATAEAAWFQLRQFGAALDKLDGADPIAVNIREAARGCAVDAPQGPVRLDGASLHTLLWPKIAVVDPSGRFRPLAGAAEPLGPLPFWPSAERGCRQRQAGKD